MQKKKAIIVDIDGTFSDSPIYDPSQYHLIDWTEVNKQHSDCPAFLWCKELVAAFDARGYEMVFLTGREGSPSTWDYTSQWLDKHTTMHSYHLIMRTPGDFRADHEVKEELLVNEVLPFYDVLFAVDDKRSNVEMFRKHGIPALLCAERQ